MFCEYQNTKTLLFCWKTFAVSSLCKIPQRCSVGFSSGTYSHVKVFRLLFTSCVFWVCLFFFFGSVFWIVMMLEYFSPGKPLEPGSCVVISTGIHGIIYKCHLPKIFCTHACKPHIVRPQPPPITVGTVFTVSVLERLIKNAGLYLSQTNLSYEFIWFEIRMCFQYSSGFFLGFFFLAKLILEFCARHQHYAMSLVLSQKCRFPLITRVPKHFSAVFQS